MSLTPRLATQPPSPFRPVNLLSIASARPFPLPAVNAPNAPLSTRFGLRLRTLRRAKGMTQLELAIAFGIDRTFISDLERGRKSVSLPFLEVFALGFGLSLSELMSDL